MTLRNDLSDVITTEFIYHAHVNISQRSDGDIVKRCVFHVAVRGTLTSCFARLTLTRVRSGFPEHLIISVQDG